MKLSLETIVPTKIYDINITCGGAGYNLYKYVKFNVRNECVTTCILNHPLWVEYIFPIYIQNNNNIVESFRTI